MKSASCPNSCFVLPELVGEGRWQQFRLCVVCLSFFGRWLDKLGLSARQGIDMVMRQVFFGAGTYHLVDANFEPLPVRMQPC